MNGITRLATSRLAPGPRSPGPSALGPGAQSRQSWHRGCTGLGVLTSPSPSVVPAAGQGMSPSRPSALAGARLVPECAACLSVLVSKCVGDGGASLTSACQNETGLRSQSLTPEQCFPCAEGVLVTGSPASQIPGRAQPIVGIRLLLPPRYRWGNGGAETSGA